MTRPFSEKPGGDISLGADNSLDFEVDCEIQRGLNNHDHNCWAKSHARVRRERNATADALEAEVKPIWDIYYVTLVRVCTHRLDSDNLVGAFKAVRDQVAQWLDIDDADPRIEWAYVQRIVNKKDIAPRKSYARVRISPDARPLAHAESLARVHATRRAPESLTDAKVARFVQKPRAIPDLAGGKPERVIELQARPNSVSSRMRIRLMRNTRDSGIGKGILYAHLSLFWEQRGIGWRSQGVSVRLEEMREVALALNAYADACGVPGLDPGAGVISPARATGRGRDTPSDDVNGTERPFPRHPQNQYGAWALAETRAQGWEPPPRPPKPADYESPDRPRKRAPKGPASVEASEPAPELDCNATAEDSDDEES